MLPYLSALKNAIVFKGALQMSRFTFTFTLLSTIVESFSIDLLIGDRGDRQCDCVDRWLYTAGCRPGPVDQSHGGHVCRSAGDGRRRSPERSARRRTARRYAASSWSLSFVLRFLKPISVTLSWSQTGSSLVADLIARCYRAR